MLSQVTLGILTLPVIIICLMTLSSFLLLFLLLMLLLFKLLLARTLLSTILVMFPPIHCLSLTYILFPASLLISSLLVNYVSLVLTCDLVLLVIVCRILRQIRFLGQTIKWNRCSSLLHSTYNLHRHPLCHMLLILLLFFL
jgi:hypothetical protein